MTAKDKIQQTNLTKTLYKTMLEREEARDRAEDLRDEMIRSGYFKTFNISPYLFPWEGGYKP